MSRSNWDELHKQAINQGQEFYQDPDSGLWVATEIALKKRPCCQSGCRHCPYGFAQDQKVEQKPGSGD